MKFIKSNDKSDSNSIFFNDSSKDRINTESIFEISSEGENLRVKNDNINCLFSTLKAENFDIIYNEFYKHLNLDFSPVEVGNKSYKLSKKEQNYLVQQIITNWIYYYSINGLQIEIKKSDFEHPYMVDYVLSVIDKKYGIDTKESLKLGARILRKKDEDYLSLVKSRRKYYDR